MSLDQGALHDYFFAGLHGLHGSRDGSRVHARPFDPSHLRARIGQMPNVGLFVGQASFPQQVQCGVPMLGSSAQSDCHLVVQFRQAPAGQVINQVAGAQPNYFTYIIHLEVPPPNQSLSSIQGRLG